MDFFKEWCAKCAHYNSRKEKCAVLGVKFREERGSCSVFIPDPAKTGERP